MTPRAVLFDVGCVLIHPQERHFRQAVNETCDDHLPEGVALRALAQAVWTGAAHPSPASFWAGDAKARAWAGHAGLREDKGPAIWRAVEQSDTVTNPLWSILDEHALPTLTGLRASGCMVAAVSNGNGTLDRDLERHGLGRCFDAVLDSFVEGVAKPDPEIFMRAAARLSVPIASCAFVGDDPHFDVAASLDAGVSRALLVDRYRVRPSDWHLPAVASLAEVAALVGS